MDKQHAPTQDALQSFISDGTPEAVRARYASLPSRAASTDFGDLDRNIVVLDTETTGFSFNHDELTQIAAARMERGEIVEWFVTFVNPGKPIPEDVAHLTDIHDEDVADAPSPEQALADLVAFVGDAKVVAHNAEFDRTFTTRHPSGYPLLENTWIDSLDLARIAVPRLKSHRLLDLVRAFGAPLSTHRADADVEATCAVFRILLAGVAAMPPALVREIARMATPDQWPTQVVFDQFARAYERSAELTEALFAKDENVSRETFSQGVRPNDLQFSLRGLRRDRLGKVEHAAKIDADDIAADPARSLVFPSVEQIAEAFSDQGLVGSLYDRFEPRQEQLDMAEAVRCAFAGSENLMVEAGTGVGKSMAYLVPSALTAQANNIAVGVATKTNALLDQLVYHELPALSDALRAQDPARPPLTYAPLKGFSHYPCLRKIGRLVEEGPQMRLVGGTEQTQAPALAALLSFVEQTEYDDMDSLKIDYRLLPRRMVTTTSHDCLRRKCPYFGTTCFVHGARRRAEAADIVVTNHSLLFCDLAADGGLLPPIRYWTVDEAHGAEAEARRAFSLALSAEDIVRLANRVSADEASRNVFVRAERRVVIPGAEEGSTLFYALTAKARVAGAAYAEAAREFVAHMKDLLFFDQNKKGKGYETVELWINEDIRRSATFSQVKELGCFMSDKAEKLVSVCQELVGYLEEVDGAAEIQREIASIAMELKDQLRAAEVILVTADDAYAYAATLNRKKDRVTEKLEALLVNVGAAMNETLFARTHSVVFASATLAVDDRFDAFEGALGLNASEFSTCRACRLDSSYDFDGHMTVYVADDMPEPNDPRYLEALQRLLVDVHRAQQGSMLTLFTNRREMEKCFETVQPQLKADDLRVVCQKWGVSVKGLRDDFLADEHLSLFALKSFWEGFDAPGATLKGVVIPKLPFAKPTDPLSCERAARDDQAWRRYVLPAAVLETKQAAGRLIRKADDTGVLILADKRLVTKGYGKSFLNSLPSRTIKVMPAAAIAEELARANGR
ncbi:helicase C-terminal domain-containing protein [Arabiibacter massiliensis]|uniref:helicase C-terminal domain-containing protein n=1 Tax=Arabiibacter massiliensis TaxID=1870985 RepID=UPI0009BA9328|nr:helicase C-terminal domain-containing protein [Arabiibacter massiliensis]